MISLLYKATKANLNIYAYLFLEQLNANGNTDIYTITDNIKLIPKADVMKILIDPLVVEHYVNVLNNGSINITPKGANLFTDSNAKYLAVMKHYPSSLYLSGNNFPAKVSDKRCIEVLSAIDIEDGMMNKVIKAIEYGKANDLLKMKFDKFIESKFYEAILEKIDDDKPINYGIYGSFFES